MDINIRAYYNVLSICERRSKYYVFHYIVKYWLLILLVLIAGCVQTANVASRDIPFNVTNEEDKVHAGAAENKTTALENKNDTEISEPALTPTPSPTPAPNSSSTPASTSLPAPTPTISMQPVCADSVMDCPGGSAARCKNRLLDGSCTLCIPDCTITAPTETPSLRRIIFTEVFYDTPGIEAKEEWVEIYNPLAEAINLSGWSIKDNTADPWIFPDITVPSHSYLRIARDASGFYNVTGCQPGTDAFTKGLNNNGDQLTLRDKDGNEVDFVAWEGGYQNAYPEWNITAQEGKSISRAITDTDSVSDWSAGEPTAC